MNVDKSEHPRVDEPLSGVICIGADTGAVFGGHLTCAILEAPDARPMSVQLPALREYAKFYPTED